MRIKHLLGWRLPVEIFLVVLHLTCFWVATSSASLQVDREIGGRELSFRDTTPGVSFQQKAEGEKIDPGSQYHAVFQTAGYLGYIAAGVGRDFKNHDVNLLIGYVPEHIGGQEIWQLALKYAWHPFEGFGHTSVQGEHSVWDPFYLGLSVIYGHHSELFVTPPDQYPDNYYPSTAFRFTLNVGTSLNFKSSTIFLEFSALDLGLIAYLENPEFFNENYDYLGLEGIGSLAIGFKIHLR